jgi:hypothetical protein
MDVMAESDPSPPIRCIDQYASKTLEVVFHAHIKGDWRFRQSVP